LLNTPPSIGDAKGSDGDSYDQVNDHIGN